MITAPARATLRRMGLSVETRARPFSPAAAFKPRPRRATPTRAGGRNARKTRPNSPTRQMQRITFNNLRRAKSDYYSLFAAATARAAVRPAGGEGVKPRPPRSKYICVLSRKNFFAVKNRSG